MNIPKIRFKEFNQEWKIKKLNEVSIINMGQSPKSEFYNYDSIGLPLIQGNADILNRKTNPKKYTSKITKKSFIGDLIMSVRAPAGSISISIHNCCIGRGVCSISSNANNDFLYQLLLYNEKKWNKYSQGTTFDVLNKNDINIFKLFYPEKEEQDKIADFISTIDTRTQQLKDKKSLLIEYKKCILQQIFSQKIRFKDEDGNDFSDWGVKKLDMMYKARMGQTIIKKDLIKEGFPVYSATENDKIFGFIKEPKFLLKSGDLVIAARGTIGSIKIMNRESVGTQTTICAIKTNNTNTNLSIIIKSIIDLKRKQVFKQSGGGIPQITISDFNSIKLFLPNSEKEIDKIANFIKSLDIQINQVEEQIEGNEEYKKGLLQQMFV